MTNIFQDPKTHKYFAEIEAQYRLEPGTLWGILSTEDSEALRTGRLNAVGDTDKAAPALGPFQIRQPVIADLERFAKKFPGTGLDRVSQLDRQSLDSAEIAAAYLWLLKTHYGLEGDDLLRAYNAGPTGASKNPNLSRDYAEKVLAAQKQAPYIAQGSQAESPVDYFKKRVADKYGAAVQKEFEELVNSPDFLRKSSEQQYNTLAAWAQPILETALSERKLAAGNQSEGFDGDALEITVDRPGAVVPADKLVHTNLPELPYKATASEDTPMSQKAAQTKPTVPPRDVMALLAKNPVTPEADIMAALAAPAPVPLTATMSTPQIHPEFQALADAAEQPSSPQGQMAIMEEALAEDAAAQELQSKWGLGDGTILDRAKQFGSNLTNPKFWADTLGSLTDPAKLDETIAAGGIAGLNSPEDINDALYTLAPIGSARRVAGAVAPTAKKAAQEVAEAVAAKAGSVGEAATKALPKAAPEALSAVVDKAKGAIPWAASHIKDFSKKAGGLVTKGIGESVKGAKIGGALGAIPLGAYGAYKAGLFDEDIPDAVTSLPGLGHHGPGYAPSPISEALASKPLPLPEFTPMDVAGPQSVAHRDAYLAALAEAQGPQFDRSKYEELLPEILEPWSQQQHRDNWFQALANKGFDERKGLGTNLLNLGLAGQAGIGGSRQAERAEIHSSKEARRLAELGLLELDEKAKTAQNEFALDKAEKQFNFEENIMQEALGREDAVRQEKNIANQKEFENSLRRKELDMRGRKGKSAGPIGYSQVGQEAIMQNPFLKQEVDLIMKNTLGAAKMKQLEQAMQSPVEHVAANAMREYFAYAGHFLQRENPEVYNEIAQALGD